MLRDRLQSLLGGEIRVRSLHPYIMAFTHVSLVASVGYSQERLEWLGDSLWQAALSVLLHKNYEFASEHALTKVRMKLIKGTKLADIGRRMHLEAFMRMSEQSHDLAMFDKAFEDTFEALLGAVYVDQGFESVLTFVKYVIRRYVDGEDLFVDDDYKKLLHAAARKRDVSFTFETTYDNQEHHTVMKFGDITKHRHAPQRKTAETLAAQALCADLNLKRSINMAS